MSLRRARKCSTTLLRMRYNWAAQAQGADGIRGVVLLADVFFQCYPTFQRFDCKVFLTEALRYFWVRQAG